MEIAGYLDDCRFRKKKGIVNEAKAMAKRTWSLW
jgi:hypothetical protein